MRRDTIITGGCIGLTRDRACHVAEQVMPLMPHAIPGRPVALRDLEPLGLAA
jgi:5-methyltetrahydrofolate--homocysteine methyltransferase